MTEISARLLVAITAISLVTCPFLYPQHIRIVQWGVVDLVLALAAWFLIQQKYVTHNSAWLMIGVCYVAVTPLIAITGGVHSYFIYLVPVSPLMTGLLLDGKAASMVAVLLCTNVLLLPVFADQLPMLGISDPQPGETLLRTFWIVLSTIVTTVFVIFYEQLNNLLRKQLRELAFNDSLTGIANRRSIMEALELSITVCRKNDRWLTVVLIDLDDFKLINDRNSHSAGDQCLQAVANCLQKALRSSSDLVGRLGGDEFIAVLPGVSDAHAQQVAEALRNAVEKLFIILPDGTLCRLTATLGYCSRKGASLGSAGELLQFADAAMYVAKQAGRNRAVMHTVPA
ncbi:MAG: diguanylate cyclase [Pseudomonadota bacterium]